MNLPVTADNRVTQFVLDLLARFKVFNSVSGCKGGGAGVHLHRLHRDKAKKALKFNVRTMVVYPVLAGLTMSGCASCSMGCTSASAGSASRPGTSSYALCSVEYHASAPGLGITEYYNNKVGEEPLQLRERGRSGSRRRWSP